MAVTAGKEKKNLWAAEGESGGPGAASASSYLREKWPSLLDITPGLK